MLTPSFPLPIVGQVLPSAFIYPSILLPIRPGLYKHARYEAANAEVKQAQALASIYPELHSGDWFEFLQQRQKIQRARLLREAGLPEATAPFFP